MCRCTHLYVYNLVHKGDNHDTLTILLGAVKETLMEKPRKSLSIDAKTHEILRQEAFKRKLGIAYLIRIMTKEKYGA